MKICIVSDSHDRGPMLARAIEAAQGLGAEAVIHCGDIIGGNTLKASIKLGLPIHAVHGNNLGDTLALVRLGTESGGLIKYHGGEADLALDGRRIYVTHYPHQARGMACTGDYDLVCCGHSHEASVTRQDNIAGGRTWLVDPGTVAGIGALASWVLGDLREMSFELRGL